MIVFGSADKVETLLLFELSPGVVAAVANSHARLVFLHAAGAFSAVVALGFIANASSGPAVTLCTTLVAILILYTFFALVNFFSILSAKRRALAQLPIDDGSPEGRMRFWTSHSDLFPARWK